MRGVLAGALLVLLAAVAPVALAATVYKWTDKDGTVHLSSDRPPAGVKYERLNVPSAPTGSTGGSRPGSSGAAAWSTAASPAQTAQRAEVLSSLRNRECVIAIEALDRMTSGAAPTHATEIKRLQQTADRNCSQDPATRQAQEAMAARLRVANSPSCVQARNLLADMLGGGAGFTREQIRLQQQFVDEHCTSPVR